MSEVKETMDYGIFKTVSGNRNISEFHIELLKRSIKKRNLTKDFPILVNSNFEILDGQHRYEALSNLGLPIYYRIAEVTTVQDIAIVNTISKKWTLADLQ